MPGFDYAGRYAYHLVAVTAGRKSHLVGSVAIDVIANLHRAAEATHFDLLAYVAMPDHVHVLVVGASDDARVTKFMQRFKQATGYRFKRDRGGELWQRSYYDHTLRREEDVLETARYILGNPVGAGLIEADESWPYQGGSLLARADGAVVSTGESGAEAPPLRAPYGESGAEAPPLRASHGASDGGAT